MLLAATTVVFGPKVWTAYVNDAMPTQRQVFFEGVHHYMAHMPTVFVNGKIAGLSFAAAMWIQAVVSATTVAAVVWTFWRRRDPVLSNALFITATFTVTPYAFNYDMVLFSWVVIKLMERTDNDAWDYGLMFAVWAIPFLTVPMGIAVLPFSCLPILAFGAKLVWRLWKAEQALTGNAAGSLRSPEQRPAPVSA